MKTQLPEEKFKLAYEKIKNCRNALILTHEHPDGDGLASACCLSFFLDSLAKKNSLFCADAPPAFFSFLPNINKFSKIENLNLENFDLIIILDCGCLARTGIGELLKTKKSPSSYIIEFDHHPPRDNFADLEIRMTDKSSTSEIIYHFFKINGLKITKEISTCLLTGILTDTANFFHPSADENSIEISSRLLVSGASLPKINKKTWQNKNLPSLKMLGKILSDLKINEKYGIVFSAVTNEEFENFRKDFKNDDDIFNSINDFLNTVRGAKATMFLREEKPGLIKGSLRSVDQKTEVIALAKFLGGGGHPRACGFELAGRIERTETGWKIV